MKKEDKRRIKNREYQRTWASKNKDKIQKYEFTYRLKTEFGITPEIYDQMLKDQKNSCLLCERTLTELGVKRLSIDHNHTTMKVRGLLCSYCNMLVGILENKKGIIKRAKKYIKRHK